MLLLPLFFTMAVAQAAIPPQWSYRIPAYVTELEVAAQSGNIVATSIYDLETAQGDNRLYYFNKIGRKIWDYQLAAQARTLEISPDGQTILLNLRNDTILAVSGTGKKLWERKGTCRAYPFREGTLCFSDDDAHSAEGAQSTVEWVDLKGKLRQSFSYGARSPDGLGFEIGPDQNSFLVWFPEGKAVLQKLKPVAQKTEFSVKGSIIRAQFHPDGHSVEILASESLRRRSFTQWDPKGKNIRDLPLPHAVSQWRWINGTLSFYGNTREGQILLQSANPFIHSPKWELKLEPQPGNYHAQLAGDSTLVTAWKREIHGIGAKGATSWSIAETRDEGNFIYRIAPAGPPKTASPDTPGGKQLVVLGEENWIRAYPIP